ncbi:AMP-binding protein [Kibdelosporangium persicum]|uniref:Linear gramicidin synthase subunit B n=1 Tax=Kibdelosporangium persicum TaxID=2698649 RepID=A0ABX2F8A2_9PSEU|nr:AMP-binding protein [Kibdelosporangium persicum]NRN67035.1 Linear gramicidin synthase subunit B [Kibdelosporangium persicum]
MPSPQFLDRFATWVADRPDTPAIRWREATITYRDLDALANAAARELVSAGLRGDDRVGVSAGKSPELVALLIALWRAGHTVMLPSHDLGSAALRMLAKAAGVTRLVTPSPVLSETTEPVGVHHVPSAGDSLLILTTSGSTGVPKLVPLSPKGVDNFMCWAAGTFDIRPGAQVLSCAPLNFDLSLLDVWTTLASGATTTLVDPRFATDGSYLAHTLDTEKITMVQAVPMVYRLLADLSIGPIRFPSVRHLVLTGDATPPKLLPELVRMFPRARRYNVYGCTETNDSTMYEIIDTTERKLPIGSPLPGVHTQVISCDGDVVEGSGSGELWVSTPFQANGYLDPIATRERFVRDPADGNTVFYRTGDVVYRDDDGVFTLEGRTDFHVKVRGARTNMAEVEHVIQRHPDVREVAVVAVPDELAGNVLHAVVCRREGSSLNSLKLREVCREGLARTAIPTTITIVEEALPKTSTGKVDRKAVLSRYTERI